MARHGLAILRVLPSLRVPPPSAAACRKPQIRISKQPIVEGCYCMWSGGEGSLDAWTAALAARLQLDSPHASRQPSVTVEAAAASTPPTGTGGAPEVLPQPAAGFPKAALHPQQAGPAQEAPPRPRPAPVQTGLHSPMIPGPVPPPFVHQHGHSAACPCLSLLPGPAGTHGLGRGLLHALWSRASTAPTPVAAHGTAVSACQSRRSLTDLTDLCLFPRRRSSSSSSSSSSGRGARSSCSWWGARPRASASRPSRSRPWASSSRRAASVSPPGEGVTTTPAGPNPNPDPDTITQAQP